MFSKRLQLQERMSKHIVETIMKAAQPKGAMVVIEAEHLCMTMRGVKKPGSKMITSAMSGIFLRSEYADPRHYLFLNEELKDIELEVSILDIKSIRSSRLSIWRRQVTRCPFDGEKSSGLHKAAKVDNRAANLLNRRLSRRGGSRGGQDICVSKRVHRFFWYSEIESSWMLLPRNSFPAFRALGTSKEIETTLLNYGKIFLKCQVRLENTET